MSKEAIQDVLDRVDEVCRWLADDLGYMLFTPDDKEQVTRDEDDRPTVRRVKN